VSIWGKKEEPPPPTRPATPPPAPSAAPIVAPPAPAQEIRKESAPLSSTPFRSPEADRNNIGKAVRIVGQIFTREDLYVDGDVEGTIESQDTKITVGPNGRVQASIKAREVVILGQVQGNVEASDKVDIRKDAKLVGDITTARISIEDGALFKGSIDIRKPEPKPAAAQAPTVSAPAPAAAPAPAPPASAAMAAGNPAIKR
jgi:cytoskeletal protein CcmA (bactofilin family)